MDRQQSFRGVILDVDGTLIDSNNGHAAAWVDALHEAGYDVPFEQVRRLIGKGGDKVLPEVSGVEADSPEGKRLSERRKEIFNTRYLPEIQPLPGTRRLLRHIRDRGLKLVVATSAQKDEVQQLLEVAEAADLIQERKTSSDAKDSKPDPDIVEAAVQASGFDPSELVMLGDTPYDIEAASKSGVASIALRSGGWDDRDLDGAIAIYDNPEDLLAHYDESPLVASHAG